MSNTKIKAGQFSGIVGHGTDGFFLKTNGDSTMDWAAAATPSPTITSVDYPGDDLAADPAGSQSVVLTGTNFAASGMTVTIGGTAASAVAHDSTTQLTITTPAKSAGDYDLVVTDGATGNAGTFVNGISYNGLPAWTTAAGTLGTLESETTISTITLAATEPDGGTITFNITSGSLPSGLSLSGANINGTTSAESSTTLYSFTVEAIDNENQSTPRTFSITVNSVPLIPTENFATNTYTGTGSTQSVSGKIGTAGSFNGSNSMIDTGITSHTLAWAYTAWFKTSVQSGCVLATLNGSGSTSGVDIIVQSGGSLRCAFHSGGNGVTSSNLYGSGNADGNWHFVAFTWDGVSGNDVVVRIDGVKHTRSTNNAGTTSHDASLKIGRLGSSAGGGYFNGSIDQVRIFNKKLSDSELNTLYAETSASSNKSNTDIFGDASGVALYEFEGNANDAGNPGVTVASGQSAVFNGSPKRIQIANNSFNHSTMSFSAWVNPSANDTYNYIFMNGMYDNRIGGSIGWYLRRQQGGGLLARGFSSNSLASAEFEVTSASGLIPLNTWTNVVCVLTTTSFKIYLNGNSNAVASASFSNAITYSSSQPAAVYLGVSYYYYNAHLYESYWKGGFDQVRIYSAELSSGDISNLYNETSVRTADLVSWYKLDGNANDSQGTNNGVWNGTAAYSSAAARGSTLNNGTATNLGFVGMDFQPDLVWVKQTSAIRGHILSNSISSVNITNSLALMSSQNNEREYTGTEAGGNYIRSLDSNGFSVAGGVYVGGSGSYVAWCWKAGGAASDVTSSSSAVSSAFLSANSAAGFSMMRYIQNGNSVVVPHGLITPPKMIIVKKTNASSSWFVYNTVASGKGRGFLESTSSFDNSGVPTFTSTNIQFQNQDPFSPDPASAIMYSFADVTGYQKVGTYTGSNSSSKVVSTGFRPRFLLIKSVSSNGNFWNMFDSVRTSGANGKGRIYANHTAAEDGTLDISFDATSFEILTSNGDINGSNDYIYLAIA